MAETAGPALEFDLGGGESAGEFRHLPRFTTLTQTRASVTVRSVGSDPMGSGEPGFFCSPEAARRVGAAHPRAGAGFLRPVSVAEDVAHPVEAEAELPPEVKNQPSTFDGVTIPSQLSGTAATLQEQLEKLVDVTGATEIMVQDMLIDPDLRSRSRELIAEAISGVTLP